MFLGSAIVLGKFFPVAELGKGHPVVLHGDISVFQGVLQVFVFVDDDAPSVSTRCLVVFLDFIGMEQFEFWIFIRVAPEVSHVKKKVIVFLLSVGVLHHFPSLFVEKGSDDALVLQDECDECWPGFFFFAREYYGEFFSCFESPARLFFVDSISRSFFLAVPAICVNGGRVRFLHFSLPVCFPDYRPRAFLGRREH